VPVRMFATVFPAFSISLLQELPQEEAKSWVTVLKVAVSRPSGGETLVQKRLNFGLRCPRHDPPEFAAVLQDN